MTIGAKKLHLLMIALLLTCVQAPALHAEMCANDVVPAATLLMPYFEVDLNNPEGRTSLMSINNAEPQPVLSHLTLWTDWSQPTIDFDIFLTGYDVVTINLRDVFSGNIPITADEQSDPMDDISPHGNNPEWDRKLRRLRELLSLLQQPGDHRDSPGPAGQRPHRSRRCSVRAAWAQRPATTWRADLLPSTPPFGARSSFPTTRGISAEPTRWPTTCKRPVGRLFPRSSRNGGRRSARPWSHIEADASFGSKSSPSGYTFYGRFTQGQRLRGPS